MKDGTVTAANASGINDGAAARHLDERAKPQKRGLDAARPHRLLGDGRRRSRDHGHRAPFPPPQAALKKAGWKVADLDLVEANEAFAAQACAVNKDMGWNPRYREREWRRHRHRPSDRRLRRPRAHHAAA